MDDCFILIKESEIAALLRGLKRSVLPGVLAPVPDSNWYTLKLSSGNMVQLYFSIARLANETEDLNSQKSLDLLFERIAVSLKMVGIVKPEDLDLTFLLQNQIEEQ